MSPGKTPQRSSLGLIVLWELFREPMHVYRMQKLLQEQGKDRVVNIRARASLYQTIERLMRLGLVEVYETVKQGGYPDRVLYAITERGRDVAREWLREMLRMTDGEYPEFVAAVSILFELSPNEAQAELEVRAEQLAAKLADAQSEIAGAPAGLPRLFLLEEDYRKAMLEAELDWIQGVVEDLRAGRLDWSEKWLREVAEQFLSPEDQLDQDVTPKATQRST